MSTSTTVGGVTTTTSEVTQFVGQEVMVGSATGQVGFFGTAPISEQVIAAAGSDAATTQALANSIRTILLAYGLVSAA